jgi:hypothetical protein
MCEIGNGPQISDRHYRIRRCLDKNQSGVFAKSYLYGMDIGRIDQIKFHPIVPQDLVK